MVFNVSGNLKETNKVKDPESQWETSSTEAMVRKTPLTNKQSKCCIIIPWSLLFISLILMGMVGSWGWREHAKLQEALKQQVNAGHHDDTPFLYTADENMGPVDHIDDFDENVEVNDFTTAENNIKSISTTTTRVESTTFGQLSNFFFRVLPRFNFWTNNGASDGPVYLRIRFANYISPKEETEVAKEEGDDAEKEE